MRCDSTRNLLMPPILSARMVSGMASEILNGFGYRHGDHFSAHAFRLGLGTEHVIGDLWEVTLDGKSISDPLHVNEVHGWLDAYGTDPANEE